MRLRNIDRRLFTILMIVFVQILGASMVLPILPLYAQRFFDMSPETITLLVSSFFMAQFVAGPYIGRMSDKYGRVPVLIISQIGTVISFVMLGAAQNVALLFLARILDGITGGNIIVAQAYITDITPREKRTQSLGYIFAAFGLGFIFGPALGGALSAVFGAQIPFYLAALAAAATVLLTWLTLDESLTPEQRETNRRFRKASLRPKEVFNNMPLMLILIVAFAGQFAMGLLQSTFALYGTAVLFIGYGVQVTSLGIGLLLSVVGVTQLVTQTFFLRQLLKRNSEGMLVIAGTILRSTGMFILAIVTSPWLAAMALVTFAFGIGIIMPSLQSMATNTVDDELRGGVLGVYQSSLSLATIFGTALAGTLFAIAPTAPYWFGSFISIIVAIPAVILYRQAKADSPTSEISTSTI